MLMFISFLYNGDYLFLSIFILLNAYLMYFYLQQMRFVKPEHKKSIFYKKIDPEKPIMSILLVLWQHYNVFAIIWIPYLLKILICFILF